MTSISSTVESAQVGTAAQVKVRNFALDRTRTFLTLVVLVHHAVIPYTYFGHTDPKSWIGFDAVVLATDSFFMAMFFFLSGLFVWPSLRHKAPQIFIRDRLLRLGLPFVIAAFTIIPLAYYAIALRHYPNIGFAEFWWNTITVGPWPSGPIWFVWLLLAFDLSASLTFADSIIEQNRNFPASVGKWQPRVPRWRANLVGTYHPGQHWSVTGALRYSGRQFNTLDNSDTHSYAYTGTSPLLVADARVRYRLDDRWSAAVGVDNLTNRTYWNFHPYNQRTWSLELRFDQ